MVKNDYKVWMCIICGWVYEEEEGCPEEGLARHFGWSVTGTRVAYVLVSIQLDGHSVSRAYPQFRRSASV